MNRIASFFFFCVFALTAAAAPIVLPKPPLVGIGVNLGLDETGKEIWIKGIVPGTPAASAGLAPNTRITRVDDVSIDGLSIGECVAKIRGPEGTKVKLELRDPTTGQMRTVEFVRQSIQIKK